MHLRPRNSLKVQKKLERYATINFQGDADFRHTTKILRRPLLEHQNVGDKIASLAVWINILRFMRDLPEAEHNSEAKNVSENSLPIMTQLYSKIYKNKMVTAARQTI